MSRRTHFVPRRNYLGCQCDPKDRAHWVVVDRHCNFSAFNGYRWTYSDYSKVVCMRCGVPWRTKAAYVDTLPDAAPDWYNHVGDVTVTPPLYNHQEHSQGEQSDAVDHP